MEGFFSRFFEEIIKIMASESDDQDITHKNQLVAKLSKNHSGREAESRVNLEKTGPNEEGGDGVVREETADAGQPIEWVEEDSDEENARVELGLVGRIWTNRHINQNAFIATMKNVWQPKHDVEIRNTGKNLYVFQFHHRRDKQRVVEGQPWHFDRHVIIMNDILGNCKPSDIPLFEFPIWARVYNLPFKGRLNNVNMKAIGDKLGTFIKMDQSGVMGIDKSVRVRIMHDVRRPLVSRVRVKMKNGVEEDFDVKYERPPLFCFICGKIGHGTKDCEEEEGDHNQEIKFGGVA